MPIGEDLNQRGVLLVGESRVLVVAVVAWKNSEGIGQDNRRHGFVVGRIKPDANLGQSGSVVDEELGEAVVTNLHLNRHALGGQPRRALGCQTAAWRCSSIQLSHASWTAGESHSSLHTSISRAKLMYERTSCADPSARTT